MSESNQVVIRYIPEVTYDTTPVDGVWETVRYESDSLSATPTTTESAEVRADRMISDMPKVGMTVGGDVNIELSATSFDDLIESAMCSTWQADTPSVGSRQLKIGTTDSSYTIEKEYADIGEFAYFSGMRVDSMNLSLSYGNIVTGSFTFAGASSGTDSTSLVGAGSTNPATTTDVLTASADVTSVEIGGVPTTICINSLDLSLANNMRAIECIGSDGPSDQRKGTATVTGSAEMHLYAESFALYEKALANESESFAFTLSDGTNTLKFEIPNAKLSGDTPPSGGRDTDVVLSLEFTGLYDPTSGSSLVITATP